jgi:hypothetical protein
LRSGSRGIGGDRPRFADGGKLSPYVDFGSRLRNGSDEAIATPGQCFDIARIVGVVAESIAHLIDGDGERAIEVDVGVFTPDPVVELFPGDDLTGPLDQRDQDPKGLTLNPDAGACFPQLA